MAAADPEADSRREWRELVAMVIGGIAALTVYGLAAPTRVHLVQLPMNGQHPDQFGVEDCVLLLGAFVAGWLCGYVATLILERRMPRFRRQGAKGRTIDRTFVVGIVVGTFAAIVYDRPTHGLIVFNEHIGAYIWAPPDLASYGVWLLAGLGIGVAAARIVERFLRARRVAEPTTAGAG